MGASDESSAQLPLLLVHVSSSDHARRRKSIFAMVLILKAGQGIGVFFEMISIVYICCNCGLRNFELSFMHDKSKSQELKSKGYGFIVSAVDGRCRCYHIVAVAGRLFSCW